MGGEVLPIVSGRRQRPTRSRRRSRTRADARPPATNDHGPGKPENAGHGGSQELDVPCRFFGVHNPGEKDQVENNLPQPSMSRWPEDNPRVRHAALGQHDEVAVARHQDAALRVRKRQLPRVGSAVKPLLDGRGDIDSPQSQAGCDSGVYVLVEVELDIHSASLTLSRSSHGPGKGVPGLPLTSALTPASHRREYAGRSGSGCRGNTPALHRRLQASNVETTPRSRQANAPPPSREQRPGHGFGCLQSGACRRKRPGSIQCGIFRAL